MGTYPPTRPDPLLERIEAIEAWILRHEGHEAGSKMGIAILLSGNTQV